MKACFVAAFSLLALYGCEQTEEETTATETPTAETEEDSGAQVGALAISVREVPLLTDPVEAYEDDESSDAAIEAAAFNSLAIDDTSLTAETGVSIGTTSANFQSAFNGVTNPSKMMCQSVRWAIDFFSAASFGDMLLCFLDAAFEDSETLYDGDEHIATMTLPADQNSEPGEESSVKFKVAITGTSDDVSGMKFWACQSGQQVVYFETEIEEDGTIASTTKRRTPGEDNDAGCSGETSGFQEFTLTSQLNSDGQYVGLKSLNMKNQKTCSNDDLARNRRVNVRQSEQYYEFKEYQVEPLMSDPTRRSMYFTEIIDTNTDNDAYAITKLGIGDGAGLEVGYNDDEVEGFDGDTLKVDDDAAEKAKVSLDDLLSTAPTESRIAFEGDEVWDCSGTSEATASADNTAGQSCNTRFSLDMDGFSFCDEDFN